MTKLYFPHLMISPINHNGKASCSRSCKGCDSNLNKNIDIITNNESFFSDVRKFFENKKLINNEVTFLYYGDFFENFSQVQNGIRLLTESLIIQDTINLGVWTRADKKMNKDVLKYLLNYKRIGKLTIKISLDFSSDKKNILNSLKIVNKNFFFIKKLNLFKKNIGFLLQLNNIDKGNIDEKYKKIIEEELKKISIKFPLLQISYSNYEKQDKFLDYQSLEKCIYFGKNVEYGLKKNLENSNDIYIDHVDILKNSIRLHNLYCKKLASNHFGTINNSASEINSEIKKFIYGLELLHINYSKTDKKKSICEFCNENLDNIFLELNKKQKLKKLFLNK